MARRMLRLTAGQGLRFTSPARSKINGNLNGGLELAVIVR